MNGLKFALLTLLALGLGIAGLFAGSVDIPAPTVASLLTGGGDPDSPIWYIVVGSRLPQAVTSLLAGASLAVAGLLLQTAFRNPLAGPSILGITSGSSLGVAIVMLFFGGTVSAAGLTVGGQTAVIIAALAGSLAVTALLLGLSTLIRNELMLLITGIMISYLTSSVITLLNYSSTAEGVYGYTMWGMGNFNGVTLGQLPVFATVCALGMGLALLLAKPLNIIQLGANYAQNLGVDMRRVRNALVLATGLLTAIVTAYCGPVSFLGLAVPHVARMVFRTSDQRVMLPGTIVTGSAAGALCNLLCLLPGEAMWPLNGVTPLIGVPVVLYVILKGRYRS